MARLLIFLCMTAIVSAYPFEATNSVYLDPSNTVLFRWAYTEDTIKFEVTMPTIGWIGIGFSPSGGMLGADIIFAWMKNGQPKVLDMYANSRSAPMLDTEQNILEYSLKQNGSHSTLFIKRYLDTCDKLHDFAITEDTTRVIFAYNDIAPIGDLPTNGNYHDVKSLRLLDMKLPVLRVEDESDIKYFDIRIKPFTIPQYKTYYHCTYHKLPEFQQKQHAVQFEILKTPGNEKNLHHIVVYHCNESLVTEEMLNNSYACYEEEDGDHWSICSPVVVAWAVGMTEITLPNHVGYPLGTPGTPKIVKFEIHYDNPDYKEGIVDTSGLRVLHTSTLRKYDAGVLMTGHDVSPGLFVPPRSKDFVVHGHCTSQCLEGILEHGGVTSINVFGVFMHSHTAGRRMVLRHYRNGTELKPIAKDLTYDFDFQETKLLANEVTVQSGDNLIMECVYDTSDRYYPTLGGLGTEDEMCFGFVMYYPKLADAYCQSTPRTDHMHGYFGVQDFWSAYIAAMTKKWTDYSLHQFNQIQLSSPRLELCRTMSGPIPSHNFRTTVYSSHRCHGGNQNQLGRTKALETMPYKIAYPLEGLQEPYNISSVQRVYQERRGRCEAEKQQEKGDRTHDLQKRSEDYIFEPKLQRWEEAASEGVITKMSTSLLSALTTLCIYWVSQLL